MNATADLVQAYFAERPFDARELVESLPSEQLAVVTDAVPAELLLPLLDHLTPSRSVELFQALAPDAQLEVLNRASPRTAVLLLSGSTAEDQELLLAKLPESGRKELQRILDFPADTAARLMDRATDTLESGMTVGQARARLRVAHVRRARSLYVVANE